MKGVIQFTHFLILKCKKPLSKSAKKFTNMKSRILEPRNEIVNRRLLQVVQQRKVGVGETDWK